MFQIRATAVFSAAHAIVIRGEREPLHGHDWRVTACLEGPELDADGLLWDFHALEADLGAVIGPWRNANLNESRTFREVNPTAEEVARVVGVGLAAALRSRLDRYPQTAWSQGLRVAYVEVTEAPGCVAVYRPG
ncbi:MAG: 6-carboxytetrahydropterin synthase [Phycisphaerae bacterium]|nr:6-carboxytetrahydropterin synthase [Phycisphaerae bacterium]